MLSYSLLSSGTTLPGGDGLSLYFCFDVVSVFFLLELDELIWGVMTAWVIGRAKFRLVSTFVIRLNSTF